MNKMRMESVDMTAQNIEKIGALFPNCITETIDENGKPKKAINFELLKQMLCSDVLEGDEAYEFTWVGKKASIVEANKPIRKTLRPCPEESKDWDNTENLYIEGDNLEVLKLLQESYLGKVKMIYIDPPYNTGHDFVYPDSFIMDNEDYNEGTGYFDEDGNINFSRENATTAGKYHSDWCSMMFSRLLLAKNLLSTDGAVFISIDDNEIDNLKKICDEIFGESNFVATLAIENNPKGRKNGKYFSINHESCVVYVKDRTSGEGFNNVIPKENLLKDSNGYYSSGQRVLVGKSSNKVVTDVSSDKHYFVYYKKNEALLIRKEYDNSLLDYKLYVSKNELNEIIENTYTSQKLIELYNNNNLIFNENTIYEKDRNVYKQQKTLICSSQYFDLKTESANFVYGDYNLKNIFSMPKNVDYIKMLVKLIANKEDTIIDFFSGSATTAHAVMQLNAEDGGSRKFIMVQLPEPCDEQSEAYKASHKNICEIGKERIRRAGEKIKSENPMTTQDLDVGFRVFKLDDSNMNDVYYSAGEYTQDMLSALESNIKADRTDLDLLFGCLLEWGLPLSMPYKSEEINGFTVHTYNDGDLIACFDENISDDVVKEIAKRKPLRAVFRDSSFANSPAKINVEEIFKLLAPDTRVKVI